MDWVPERSSSVSPERHRRSRTAALCILAILTLGAPAGCAGASGSAGPDRATVVSVVDGDTIDLDFGGRRERVRLLGVDAPESVHPSVPTQCFGPEASHALDALLPAGAAVRVERDLEARDRYDRLLLYVYRQDDDLFVNRWLLDNGLADTAFYEPNTARAPELTLAVGAARSGGIGLWGSCDGPDQPLDGG